jgi:uncharacterized protein YfbU (UPF0304 family)
MELTKKDRVILINQYEILKRLDTDWSDRYDELIDILESGYEIFYHQVHERVSDDMSTDECKLVLDVLNIYRAIENYKNEHPDDNEISNHLYANFPGFDGNSETIYMAFTQFLIERQDKFAEQAKYKDKTGNFNSHSPMLDKYKAMITKWKSIGGKFKLLREDIITILNS